MTTASSFMPLPSATTVSASASVSSLIVSIALHVSVSIFSSVASPVSISIAVSTVLILLCCGRRAIDVQRKDGLSNAEGK